MDITTLTSNLQAIEGRAQFVSCTYTDKRKGETARYTLAIGRNYIRSCEKDLLELKLMLRGARGLQRVVIEGLIDSVQESINARHEGREHLNYTKRGLYLPLCNGIKLFTKDCTLEIQGFEHARKVLVPGLQYLVRHRSPDTALKAKLRAGLRIGRVRTLCLDPGHIHSVRLNGQTIVFV
jgi:hypothetical protein